MIRLNDLSDIQHLLGDDAGLLAVVRSRHHQTIILVDTGCHREGNGRYVTWILGHDRCSLLGHYCNDARDARRDLHQRSIGRGPQGNNEQE